MPYAAQQWMLDSSIHSPCKVRCQLDAEHPNKRACLRNKVVLNTCAWRIESSLSHPQMVLDMTGSYIVPTLILRSPKDRMQLGLACFRTGKDFLVASYAAWTTLGLQG